MFVNVAVEAVVLIVPVSPVFSVVKSSLAVSTTVYVTSVGRPVAILLSPSFSLKVATPFVNVMPPYVPLIEVSPSVTVNSNSTFASAARSLTTVFVTSRSPTSWVLVKMTSASVEGLIWPSAVTVA